MYLLFPFDLNFFKKSFVWGGLRSSNLTFLLAAKLGKMFVIVLLKKKTCLLIGLLLNKVSQLTNPTELSIPSMFAFL